MCRIGLPACGFYKGRQVITVKQSLTNFGGRI